MCMGVMDMVRWILDSERVLDITIYIYIGNVYLTHWVLNIIYHSGGGLLL
jgi:hypothetical protein